VYGAALNRRVRGFRGDAEQADPPSRADTPPTLSNICSDRVIVLHRNAEAASLH
jgi:hypothetical protein